MKRFIAFIAALCIALPAAAAPKKDDKGKKTEKEVPPTMWSVVVEGATDETAAETVKAFLAGIKGVKVESAEKKENTVEAVISSKEKISRSDVSKALKEKKEFKVKEFKVKRPEKEKKDTGKTGEPKKDGDKTEPKKDGDKTEPKKESDKTEPKKDGDKTEPKKEDVKKES